MESIERLREYINGTTISTWTRNYIDQHIDAIEREVDIMGLSVIMCRTSSLQVLASVLQKS